MSTVQVAPLSPPTTPLSPDQFPGSDNVANSVTPAPPPGPGPFTESDRATLRTARELMTAARVNLASSDAQVKQSGRKQIEAVSSYLVGFCDGRGLINTAPVRPGFEDMFGATDSQPDLNAALDELDAVLERVLAAAETRGWTSFAHAVGDACIAVGAALLLA
ncbi:MAG: hypothetical protein QOG94_27 [Solirubrobacteraceae bacterium]|jgi:hypothetical protein|nr:hypothetical protein [Solirubrobacteraceae bacterium]